MGEGRTEGGQEPRTAADSSAGDSGWVTTDVAAAALEVSPRTVRRYIERGDLIGHAEEEGITKAWLVSIDSLQALRDRRASEGHGRRESVAASAPTDSLADVVESLAGRLEARAAEAAEMRARLELTERAESTIREERERLRTELEREREQHREDLERERGERGEAQEEARRLREELVAERSKGFWRRLFGG